MLTLFDLFSAVRGLNIIPKDHFRLPLNPVFRRSSHQNETFLLEFLNNFGGSAPTRFEAGDRQPAAAPGMRFDLFE